MSRNGKHDIIITENISTRGKTKQVYCTASLRQLTMHSTVQKTHKTLTVFDQYLLKWWQDINDSYSAV